MKSISRTPAGSHAYFLEAAALARQCAGRQSILGREYHIESARIFLQTARQIREQMQRRTADA